MSKFSGNFIASADPVCSLGCSATASNSCQLALPFLSVSNKISGSLITNLSSLNSPSNSDSQGICTASCCILAISAREPDFMFAKCTSLSSNFNAGNTLSVLSPLIVNVRPVVCSTCSETLLKIASVGIKKGAATISAIHNSSITPIILNKVFMIVLSNVQIILIS